MPPKFEDYSEKDLRTMRNRARNARDADAVRGIDKALEKTNLAPEGTEKLLNIHHRISDECSKFRAKKTKDEKIDIEKINQLLDQMNGRYSFFISFPPSSERYHRSVLAMIVESDLSKQPDDLLKIVNRLLNEGANPNHYDSRKNALHAACSLPKTCTAKEAIIKLCLQHGANPECESFRETPLRRAIANKDFETAKILLEHGADPNRVVNDQLPTVVDLVRGLKTPPDTQGNQADLYSKEKKAAMLDLLISRGAYVKGMRSPTEEEKAAMTEGQLESWRAAKFSQGAKPEDRCYWR